MSASPPGPLSLQERGNPSLPDAFPLRETAGLLLGLILLWFTYYYGNANAWPAAWLQRLGPHWPDWVNHWGRFFWFGVNFLALFVIPALVIKLVWHERLRDYGLGLGEVRVWGKYFLGFLLVMVPVILWASRLPSLRSFYPLIRWAGDSPGAFALAAGGWLVYFFAWEFFFRGFMLNLVARRYGAIAIVVQTIPFTLMHLPKPEVEAFAAIIAGMALGFMAYRGKSMLGTWAIHWAVAVGLDLLVVIYK